MGQRHLLTLLSDFGLSDTYVGVMKGVIARVNPAITVVDLTHQIPPQNVALARFALMTAYPYFPTGTVHVAVVDPDVGGDRRAIALAIGQTATDPAGFLVGPDNGLFSGILADHPLIRAFELTNSAYWRTAEPSPTFHGRDIFAPVGAHLATGAPIEALGTGIDPATLVMLNLPPCRQESAGFPSLGADRPTAPHHSRFTGSIQAIDHFGNLITNIPGRQVSDRPWLLAVKDVVLSGQRTYSESAVGALLALIGSHGWIEIAVNCGNAQARLKLELGDRVVVETETTHVETT